MTEAIRKQFDCVLRHEPSAGELSKYLALTRSAIGLAGNTEGLRQILKTVLLKSEFLCRLEFGAGVADGNRREMLSSREGSYATCYAIGDGGPDAKLIEAAALGFRALAQQQNVYCKVSALYGRVKKQPEPGNFAFYSPVIDLVFDCFGEDRWVFGSDWPVTEMTGDYASVLKLTKSYFDRKGRGVSEKVFHRNAAAFYRVPDLD